MAEGPVHAEGRMVTKGFVMTSAISFLCLVTEFLLTVSIASYAMKEFGVSVTLAGLASGLFVLGGLLSRMLFGRYIEYVGRKRMLMFCLTAVVLAASLYFISSTFAVLCITRFIHGAALAMCNACASDIVNKMIPDSRRAEGLGYFLLGLTLALAVGPFIGLMLIGDGRYDMIFSLCIGAYILSILIAVILKVPEEVLTDEQRSELRRFDIKGMLERKAIPQSLVAMILMLSFSGVMSFISPYSSSVGLTDAAPVFYLVYSVVTVISRFSIGKIFDRKGANVVMIPAFISFIVAMLIYSAADSILHIIVSGIMMGFAVSTIFPSSQAIILKGVEPARYGSSISTYLAVSDLGSGFGPMIIGAMVDSVGYRPSYVICAVIAVSGLMLYWFVYGSKHRGNGNTA